MEAEIAPHPALQRFFSTQQDLIKQLHSVNVGLTEPLGFDINRKTELTALTETIDKSGKIEGEELGTDAIRSSVARQVGH